MRAGRSERRRRSLPHKLLAISDLHLGGDLRRGVTHTAPPPQDAALVALLDQLAPSPPHGRPTCWRLVVAGDLVDFIGISLVPAPHEAVPFRVTPEEERGGLGPESDKAVWKLSQVVSRHRRFVERLARFVADGHDLVIVAGNHDQEWRLSAVRRAFVAALESALQRSCGRHEPLAARVLFRDWFHLEPGRLYVEHGHRYDEYCVAPEPADDPTPTSTKRQEENSHTTPLAEPVSTVALRLFGHHHGALDLNAIDGWTPRDFLRWAYGGGRFVRVLADYGLMSLRMLVRALRARWIGPRRGDEAARRSVTERLARSLAGVVADHLRLAGELSALLRPPASDNVVRVAQMLFVDRVLLAGGALLLLAGCAAASMPAPWRAAALVATVALAWRVDRRLARARLVDAHPKLWGVAGRLAALFDVPVVVMGHSHRPVDAPVGARARYINLGSWLPSPQHGGVRFPYLVVDKHGARLMQWGADTRSLERSRLPTPRRGQASTQRTPHVQPSAPTPG